MKVKVERIDHLGIVASVIKELKIVEMIDNRILTNEKEEISTGEAVAGMIINGLGFSDRPLSLTPQFFENKALELLFRKGVEAEHFNRFKLGRSLDAVVEYGCNILFSEISLAVCTQEKVSSKFAHNDTTSFSLTGKYDADTDEHEVKITYGYSKDHRPDLKQIILELVVNEDGIPTASRAWNGNKSDNAIFKERAQKLVEGIKESDGVQFVVGDSKIYTEQNAENLKKLRFITRMPGTLDLENQLIIQSFMKDKKWQRLDDSNKFQIVELVHYGMEVRCIIVFSDEAKNRSMYTVEKWKDKEAEKIEKELFRLQAQRFDSEEKAELALLNLAKKWKYHTVASQNIILLKKYTSTGRPKKNTQPDGETFQINATIVVNQHAVNELIDQKSCYVLVTNTSNKDLSDVDVVLTYKQQNNTVEKGFAFLKNHSFFAASLYLKNPARIQGLLMVMTLALLVYSIAQRRIRRQLESLGETLPNQIKKPTATPTLRWLFQILHGINLVIITIGDKIEIMIEGISDLKKKILSLLGDHVRYLYKIS